MILFDNIYQSIYSVVETLKINNLKIGTAESCTGGLLSAAITEIPGSSVVFYGGICAYSNHIKTKILNIPEHILQERGAVSKEVAILMAINVRKILNVDIGVGITGIAGPDGGSIDKPVGTVWIGIADTINNHTKLLNLHGKRRQIRLATIEHMFIELKSFLDNKLSNISIYQ